MDRRLLKNLDHWLILVTLTIVCCGCFAMYSAGSKAHNGLGYVERQLMWLAVGLVAAVVTASIDLTHFTRHAGKLYAFTVLSLLAVLILGHESKGAQRWIGIGWAKVQPSEFAKVFLIVALAVFLVRRYRQIRTFKTFVLSFLYLAVPTVLIFKQPDLGTSLVMIAVWITMLFVMGTDIRNLALFAAAGLILGTIAWFTPGILHDYQKKRVITLINPQSDPRASGYHVTQARIAIGSGQMTGKGYLKGTQRELSFIPEQHTDFIFTVIAEEFGFLGAAGLVGLYILLLWRALLIAITTEDSTGRAIAAGVTGMFLFHVFVNIGMTLGVMPVTGVPLPMFSYGGSSLMSNLMAVGLLEGVSMRRQKIAF